MKEGRISRYGLLKEVRTNHRFATFQGVLDGGRVFIKQAVNPALQERLLLDAVGHITMRELDRLESVYRVPAIIEVSSDFIVTQWADGAPMQEDFRRGNERVMTNHLAYLLKVYLFIDQRSSGVKGVTRFNLPDEESGITRILDALKKRELHAAISTELVEQTTSYVNKKVNTLETRFTNGDLQPGNILVVSGSMPTLVDCETCSWLWPRHYNIVNFLVNYGIQHPWLMSEFEGMFSEYCRQLEIIPEKTLDAFNVSAAMRCLQMIEENFSDHGGISSQTRAYIETIMERIVSDKLFIDS